MPRRKKKNLTREEVEKLSKDNAKRIIQGRDRLKSWGKSGWWKSQKLGKYFHFRSMIEANVLRLLDSSEHIVDFDTEKFKIPYNFKGAELNYVPDIILKTKNDNVFVVEVKPSSQLDEEKNLAKWETAKTWCWSRGVRFFVITERDWESIIDIIKLFENDDVTKAQSLMEWKLISNQDNG